MEPSSPEQRSREELRDDFRLVVRDYRAPLLLFLRRYTGEMEAAEDLSQETFVKAYFQLDRFDDRRPFQPWLFTIAANCARDYLRKRTRQTREQKDVEAAIDIAAPDRLAEARERHEELEMAIGALPATLREPLLLHYQLDWSAQEIAQHLGIETGAVKTRLHRARGCLQRMLSPEEELLP